MFKLLKKWWKYTTAKLTGSFNERADPKVQLEQAIMEAQSQHKRLKEQAVNGIAGQKQAEIRLNGKMTELEKLNEPVTPEVEALWKDVPEGRGFIALVLASLATQRAIRKLRKLRILFVNGGKFVQPNAA